MSGNLQRQAGITETKGGFDRKSAKSAIKSADTHISEKRRHPYEKQKKRKKRRHP